MKCANCGYEAEEYDDITGIKTKYVDICGRVALSIGEIKEQYPDYPYNEL